MPLEPRYPNGWPNNMQAALYFNRNWKVLHVLKMQFGSAHKQKYLTLVVGQRRNMEIVFGEQQKLWQDGSMLLEKF